MDNQEIDFGQGNMKIENELGSGAFGKVYSGYLKSNGLKIAVKRLNKKKMREYGEYLFNALKKELECMAKCNCENSVRLYKHIETANNFNIIMELCDGDLSKELKKRPEGFNVEEVRYIMSQLNNVFKKMQENKIIHRDLKLGNILIKYTDETKTKFIPKLCDYGFSKELKDQETHTMLGTPATMAPEVINGLYYDARADLWSIGVLIYELHFKSLPFPGKSAKEIDAIIRKELPNAHVLAAFDTLEYLKKGGRLSSAKAIVGKILSIKPLLTIEDGVVNVWGKARGTKNIVGGLMDKAASYEIDFDKPIMFGFTGAYNDSINLLMDRFRKEYKITTPVTAVPVGATIGTYAGPGAVAVAFFSKEKE